MIWRSPWKIHRDQSCADLAASRDALKASRASIESAETLGRENDAITRENHLAPRLAAAFRLREERAR